MRNLLVFVLSLVMCFGCANNRIQSEGVLVPKDQATKMLPAGSKVEVLKKDGAKQSLVVSGVGPDSISSMDGVETNFDSVDKIFLVANSQPKSEPSKLKTAGLATVEVVGIVVVLPFVLVCMAFGGCDMR